MSITLWVALGVAYLNIGFKLGRFSQKAWRKKRRSIAGLLCFPLSYMENEIGEDDPKKATNYLPINSFDAQVYTNLMAFTWPIKLAFNLFVIACMGVCFTTIGAFILATNPTALLPKRTTKELPAAPVIEPTLDHFTPDEYYRIRTRFEEMETHPDKEKILAMPRRP